jgi:putative aminopeptidase FrvX
VLPAARTFLDDLLRAHGPSGHEEPAAAVWRAYTGAFARVHGDVLGSSYARVGPDAGPPVLLLGHLDEIGLIVTLIEDSDEDADGLLRVRELGVWDPQVLVGQHVTIRTRRGDVHGVVGKGPRHLMATDDLARASELRDLWVDIGARDADDARSLVEVGDPLVIDRPPAELANGRVASRALDNRTGAWVVAEAARRAAAAGALRVPLVAGAPTLEETLMDGARAMAHAVAPAVSIVVDVTHASDIPGIDRGGTGRIRLGHGPVLTRGLGLHHGLQARLEAAAREAGIPFQTEAMPVAGTTYTDVDGALDALTGSAVALISIPLRHMHSPAEVCALADLDAAAELIARLCLTLTPEDLWDR